MKITKIMEMEAKVNKRTQGTALLSVILLLATVTLLVTEMTERQFLDIRRTSNIIAQDQAYLYVQAAEALAIRALLEDFKAETEEGENGLVDHLNDEWKQKVVFPVDGGTITAELTDLQNRFNINDLLSDRWQARARFMTLLRGLDLGFDTDPGQLVNAIVEWMDEDTQSQTGAAEDTVYLGYENPYRAGNSLLISTSELRLIDGFTPELIDQIAPYIVAIPEGVPVNINTVDVEILTTYANIGDVKAIIDGRGDEGYTKVEDAFTKKGKKPDFTAFSVHSEYFLLESKAVINGRASRLRSILYRPKDLSKENPIKVISRNQARQFKIAKPKEG